MTAKSLISFYSESYHRGNGKCPQNPLPVNTPAFNESAKFSRCPCGVEKDTIYFKEEEEATCPKHRPLLLRRQSCGCIYETQTFGTVWWCKMHRKKYPLTVVPLAADVNPRAKQVIRLARGRLAEQLQEEIA